MNTLGPKKFIECFIPVSSCNLHCDYCYIVQQGRRNAKLDSLKYPVETIVKSLSKERMGGVCFFSFCGGGETLLPNYIVPLVHGLLRQGHYVNITNNGTITERIKELCSIDVSYLKHLLFSFSFHFLELQKRNLIDTFFDNCNFVRSKGCSFFVQMNLYDGYLPYLETIKKLCKNKIGAYPRLLITRDEDYKNGDKLLTNLTELEYFSIGRQIDDRLWVASFNNFMKKQKGFCYAGDWTATLNIQNGFLSKCYFNQENAIDIFEKPDEPIRFAAVGHNCKHFMCSNSTHFLAMGAIPKNKFPTYGFLRNREEANWFSDEMYSFLNLKLRDCNAEYSLTKKFFVDLSYLRHKFNKFLGNKIKK